MVDFTQIERTLKAWLEITDTPSLVVPAFAQRSSIKIDSTDSTISLRFSATTAELDAVVMGKRYRVESSRKASVLINFTPTSRLFKIEDKTGSQGYTIEEQDPVNSEAIAYFQSQKDSEQGVGLQIVKPLEVSGNNQIAIKEGGVVEVSDNLIGKNIKVRLPVTYPEVALIATESIQNIASHLIVLWKSGDIKYICFPGVLDNLSYNSNLKHGFRDFTLKFIPENIKVVDLKISAIL